MINEHITLKWLGVIERSIVVLFFVAVFAFQGRGQAEPKVAGDNGQAVRTLQRYLHLRLQDADWKEYSIRIPLAPNGTYVYFGVASEGGTTWADDLELLIDGQPVWEATPSRK